jgi:hypothetical protein
MATLNVTHKESIILNGQQFGGTNIFSIAGINDVFKRIVTCPAGSDTTIAIFDSTEAIADGSIDLQDAKYVRVTNLDSSNSVNLSIQLDSDEDDTAANESATCLLAAGQSFVIGTPHESFHVNDDAATIITALTDIESILIDPSSNEVRMEILVASS